MKVVKNVFFNSVAYFKISLQCHLDLYKQFLLLVEGYLLLIEFQLILE